MKPNKFPAAMPHGEIKEIFPDVFLVAGRFRMMPGLVILRNMVIIRSKGELTLINCIRLTNQGQHELEALGEIKHIIRLGDAHSCDFPFYKTSYDVTYWGLNNMRECAGMKPDKVLVHHAELPFPNTEVFIFNNKKHGEAAIILQREGGVLITCDSVVNSGNMRKANFFAKLFSRLSGVIGHAKIPKFWRMRSRVKITDYDELLTHDFKHLLSAHGKPLLDDAKQCLTETVKNFKCT